MRGENMGNSKRFKRILLVSPGFSRGRHRIAVHPLSGLGYIAESLNRNGFEVSVFDMNLQLSYKDLDRRFSDFNPDLIGFTVMTFGYKDTFDLICKLKKNHPGIKAVVGGPHVSMLKAKVLEECPAIDYGIIMEGDRSIVQLCEGDNLRDIGGFIFRQDGKIVVNPFKEFIADLDSLTFPKYEVFDLKKYPTAQIGIVTSRGCPYSCIYCPVISAIGKKFRMRSARSVVNEIVYWYSKGYKDILILDDNFTLIKDRVEEICDLLARKKMSGISLKCPNGIRADRVNYNLLKKMREAGFDMVGFGVEASANHVLENIKKGESFAIIEENVKNACQLGFDVDLFFLIGSPGETREDVEQSFLFAQRYPIRNARFYNIIPFPTTELYKWLDKNNLFLHSQDYILNNASHFINEPCFYTPEMSVQERKEAFMVGQRVSRMIRIKYIESKIRVPILFRSLLSRILVMSFVERLLNGNILVIKIKENFKKVFSRNQGA